MTTSRHLVDLTTLMTLIVSACIGPINADLYNNIASHFTGCNTIVAFIMHHSAMRASALFVAAIAVSTSSPLCCIRLC